MAADVILIGPQPSPSIGDFLLSLLSNPGLTAVLGAVVGGAIAYASAVRVATAQRRDTHRAAVRAVVYELTENLPKVDNATAPGHLTTAAYDALLVPLYTDLPDEIAHHVSFAYALLHVTGDTVAGLPAANQQTIRTQLHAAQAELRRYAETTFRMNFDPPSA